ncbi:hypothetical protein MSAN_00984300 [Mycena sanguinolenta]|uniref:Uncharacterized protein n=1 Tax=Mycena sanguinolenta TaxID=230812 RepID=A0A8H6YS10_9AGAR|nr:hypothetical protein MSAN_00984300 [Mycena sanguinolenta]
MVKLSLASTKGNHGVRYFPYSGYLGLTTLKVDGVVRTNLEVDQKPLLAKSITISVRCYETRFGVLGVVQSNVLVDYTQVLWSKPEDDQEYAEIADLELPFRILIPSKVGGFSSASYSSVYKMLWRVEAIINHIPILGVGSRQIKHSELPLLRFGLPYAYEPSTPIAKPILHSEISHPHTKQPIRYSVGCPTTPIGPLDLVSIPIHLLPSDSDRNVVFRSASVIVERRMQFLNPPSPPATPTVNTSPTSPALPSLQSSSSLPIPQRTPSTSSFLSYSPSKEASSFLSSSSTLQPSDSRATGASLLVNSIAGTESSGLFTHSGSGVWSKTLTLQWPAAKSYSRWAIGESIESDLVSVKFFVRVKIVFSTPSGTDSLELQEQELLIVSTNDAERQLALSKYNEAYAEGARSKSKSPRRSSRRNEEDGTSAPPLPNSPSSSSHRVSSSTSTSPASSSKPKPPRRPHTSAGPRRPGSATASQPDTQDAERDLFRRRRVPRPERSEVDEFTAPRHGKGKAQYPPPPLTVTTTPLDSGGSASSTSLSTTTSSSSPDSNPSDEMREWEQELARIEMRSRRSSDLVGFANKRRRPGDPYT